ncbi:MAG TPA: universal stress protein [Actinoplanes sp.]|nr:universal stress protein [Actinoplanes sp.]
MGYSIGVGIGGSGGSPALAWAAEQTDWTHTPLVLVHVCPPGSPLEHLTGGPAPAELELIDPPLARAYAKTRARVGGQRVSLRIFGGDPSDRLAEASAGVRLLVIGAGAGGRTVRRVLRQAHCPVVVARATPPPASRALFGGHVVIGVDGSSSSQTAMEFAARYADEHRLPLAAVHVSAASSDDHIYDDVTLSTQFTTEPAARELLADATEPWTVRCPAMPIRRAVLHGPVIEALTRAGVGARLLVVGDKRRGVIGRARTGDVPLTVATEASCPVAVVPEHQHETGPL